MGRDEGNAVWAVLRHAETCGVGRLPYDELPEVRAAFASRRELLLALQYRWSQALWTQISALARDPGQANDAHDLAARAWAQCAAKHPVLLRLLDEHRAELGPPLRRQSTTAA